MNCYICNIFGIRYIFIFVSAFLFFYGCSRSTHRSLEPGEQNGVRIESRSWSGLIDPEGGFELVIINNGSDHKNCSLIFDDKYEHSFVGLQNQGKGMIRDSIFRNGDTITLNLSHDISDLLTFRIEEKNYLPSTVRIKCSEFDAVWNFNK